MGFGRDTAIARSLGGRKRADMQTQTLVRPILIEYIFSKLQPGPKRTPTGKRTLHLVKKQLATEFNIHVSAATLLRDIKKIGTAKLRK